MDTATAQVLDPPSTDTSRPAVDRGQTERAQQTVEAVEVVDRQWWNTLVCQQPGFELEQGWQWGEVQREAGWTPHRYAAFRGPVCVGTVSVTRRRLPGLPYSVLYASRGPLVAWDDEAVCRSLVAAMRRLAHDHRAILLRLSPSLHDGSKSAQAALARLLFREIPEEWTTWNAPRVTMAMGLEGDPDAILRRLRRRIRQNIASAPRRGLRVRTSNDRRDLAAFQRLLVAMGREKKYPVRRQRRLEALWNAFVVTGDGVLVLVESNGDLLAGLLGARLGPRASLQCAAVVRDRANRPHGPLAYWTFIQWAKAAGCDSIDFGGSATHFPPRETDDGYGVYQFKAGFGSELRCAMTYHDLVFHPGLYRLARAAERWILPQAWHVRARLNY